MTEIDRVFRAGRQLRSLVVQDDEHFLLSREQVEFTVTGRPGCGRGLQARSRARQMVPENSFFLPGAMTLATAAQRVLELSEGDRYRDVLVLPTMVHGWCPYPRSSNGCRRISGMPRCTIR